MQPAAEREYWIWMILRKVMKAFRKVIWTKLEKLEKALFAKTVENWAERK